MPQYSDLPLKKKLFANQMFVSVTAVINLKDFTGHVARCGYSDDNPTCDCSELGTRLMAAIVNEVAKYDA